MGVKDIVCVRNKSCEITHLTSSKQDRILESKEMSRMIQRTCT